MEENEGMNAHLFRRENWMIHFKKDVQKMFYPLKNMYNSYSKVAIILLIHVHAIASFCILCYNIYA